MVSCQFTKPFKVLRQWVAENNERYPSRWGISFLADQWLISKSKHDRIGLVARPGFGQPLRQKWTPHRYAGGRDGPSHRDSSQERVCQAYRVWTSEIHWCHSSAWCQIRDSQQVWTTTTKLEAFSRCLRKRSARHLKVSLFVFGSKVRDEVVGRVK